MMVTEMTGLPMMRPIKDPIIAKQRTSIPKTKKIKILKFLGNPWCR